ncbi:hypothetical protein [Magnetospirillum sp. 15-1]|uniref:hypothetical protein n=1 Tax=Magnetospirillum sp. 15-1 TaxID=1979370 RepID=UPI000BBBA74E|nr:hypothetical protein [Magnetospirillum sp. 15-1]
MKFSPKDPPRTFPVGNSVIFDMKDCGTLALAPDEQVTLVTESGGEYDVARKDWGFYATPSLNGRLEQFGLRAVLIVNRGTGRYFLLLVEAGKEELFDAYCRQENLAVVAWLDNTAACGAVRAKLAP